MSPNDKQMMMPSAGIPTLMLKHTTLNSSRASGSSTKLTVGAYRNGMGSICMLHWDLIPCHINDLDLHKNDRPALRKKLFKLVTKVEYQDDTSSEVDRNNLNFEFLNDAN